jgi:hypothetical protein
MAKPWKPVSEKLFGNPLADSQNTDEPYDPAFNKRYVEGVLINGRGAQGGGSKPTPQRALQARGMTHNRGSYPRMSQKIRG